jgi:hypothetical protein
MPCTLGPSYYHPELIRKLDTNDKNLAYIDGFISLIVIFYRGGYGYIPERSKEANHYFYGS